MSSTDDDGTWTVSPFCNYVSAVSTLDDDNFQHGVACGIILDSGVDTSALLLRFGQVGVEDVMPGTSFIDAQGMPLNVTSSRIAHVVFGDILAEAPPQIPQPAGSHHSKHPSPQKGFDLCTP